MRGLLQREPVMAGAIVSAIIAAAAAYGLELTPATVTGVLDVLILGIGLLVRSKVTPV